jgi:hypothetical protein
MMLPLIKYFLSIKVTERTPLMGYIESCVTGPHAIKKEEN